MSGARKGTTGRPPVVPGARLPSATSDAVLDDVLLVDALAALAAADSRAQVAAAALPLLVDRPGVRACAVVGRDGDTVVVLGSAGYGCGSMSAGAALPLDAGLPVTEAVRTGRLVELGTGPAWVAAPFGAGGRSGALLLSLDGGPLGSSEDRARLLRLARALGDALHRAHQQERAVADLALLTASLAGSRPATPAADAAVAVRQVPYDGPVGGDVALVLPDGRGGTWLLVADVCGSGLLAAVVARTVHTAASALAAYVRTPGELLDALDRAVRPDCGPGVFVTALAVHLADGTAVVASAGHPLPLVLHGGVPTPCDVEPGQPLALETGVGAACAVASFPVPAGALLVLQTDGLTDRRGPGGSRDVDLAALLPRPVPDEPAALADALLRAADAVGPAQDDVTVLVVRHRLTVCGHAVPPPARPRRHRSGRRGRPRRASARARHLGPDRRRPPSSPAAASGIGRILALLLAERGAPCTSPTATLASAAAVAAAAGRGRRRGDAHRSTSPTPTRCRRSPTPSSRRPASTCSSTTRASATRAPWSTARWTTGGRSSRSTSWVSSTASTPSCRGSSRRPGGARRQHRLDGGPHAGGGMVPYSTTKAAVVGMCEALDREVAGSGVRVHALCPGVIDTAIVRTSTMRGPWTDKQARTTALYATRARPPTSSPVRRSPPSPAGACSCPTPRYQVVPPWLVKRAAPSTGAALSTFLVRRLSGG